jgi:hypothetical protein
MLYQQRSCGTATLSLSLQAWSQQKLFSALHSSCPPLSHLPSLNPSNPTIAHPQHDIMKINLILLALTSLFFTVLGHPGVECQGYEEKCNTDTRRPAILQCKSGLWDHKLWCPGGTWCDPGPPASCKMHHANARPFDDAAYANVASSPTATTPAETCYGNEWKCSRNGS